MNLRSVKDLFLLLLMAAAVSVNAQTAARPSAADLTALAEKQTSAYVDAFKNLLADETKTFEVFDKNGGVKKRKVIVSNFVVYQFTKDQNQLNEYRNIVAVDGKPISNAEKRAEKFFEQVQRVESSAAELKRLQDESLRFDEGIAISGLTLFQSLALASDLRPFFEYRIDSQETLNGRPVYVLSYRQTKDTPNIRINADDSASGIIAQTYDIDVDRAVPLNARLRGRLWIDAETFQVWKEHRELTVQPEGFTEPAVAIENEFEYQASEFGILTPKRISHTQYRVRVKERTTVKEVRVTFEYGKFSKPDVDVKADEVKQP